MKKVYIPIIATLFVFAISAAACAEESAKPGAMIEATARAVSSALGVGTKCPLRETCSLNVNFTFMENNPRGAKNVMDKRSKEIEEIAKKAGAEKFDLQSYNFNIYPQNNNSSGFDDGGGASSGFRYQVSGSLNYNVTPSDKAITIMEQLLAMKIQSSLNVNAYKENCGQ